jgi:threonine synthase
MSPGDPYPFRCPNAGRNDTDHVLTRILGARTLGKKEDRIALFRDPEPNPFVRYRRLFHSYHLGLSRGLEDDSFVEMVQGLDAGVAAADGRGFRETPFGRHVELDQALGFAGDAGIWIKDETGNVAGTHKARHLMGVMIWLEAVRRIGLPGQVEAPSLAVASCGNAALAAAVVARAAGYDLQVFVPPDADRTIVRELRRLGARIVACPRADKATGDPCYTEFRESIDKGALPFSVQGNMNGLAVEGGGTLAYEMISALLREDVKLDRLFVQVGGGALASSCIQAFLEAQQAGLIKGLPRFHAVQTEGAFPLQRAYDRIVERILQRIRLEVGDGDGIPQEDEERADVIRARISSPLVGEEIRYASTHRSEFMWPWEETPRSIATAILDDETYDWFAVVRGMLRTGGYPVVVREEMLHEANDLGRRASGIDADHTGTAGLAGCLALSRKGIAGPREKVAVLFTGVRR